VTVISSCAGVFVYGYVYGYGYACVYLKTEDIISICSCVCVCVCVCVYDRDPHDLISYLSESFFSGSPPSFSPCTRSENLSLSHHITHKSCVYPIYPV